MVVVELNNNSNNQVFFNWAFYSEPLSKFLDTVMFAPLYCLMFKWFCIGELCCIKKPASGKTQSFDVFIFPPKHKCKESLRRLYLCAAWLELLFLPALISGHSGSVFLPNQIETSGSDVGFVSKCVTFWRQPVYIWMCLQFTFHPSRFKWRPYVSSTALITLLVLAQKQQRQACATAQACSASVISAIGLNSHTPAHVSGFSWGGEMMSALSSLRCDRKCESKDVTECSHSGDGHEWAEKT